jgi:hypothetical protein
MSIWPWPVADGDEVPAELPVADEALRRWRESLDTLQRQAEGALELPGSAPAPEAPVDGITSWAPPGDLVPLPEILQERARNIVALQQQAVDLLAASRIGVEHEMAQLARPRRQVRPVYVDVTG